jgi:hypothetical protein
LRFSVHPELVEGLPLFEDLKQEFQRGAAPLRKILPSLYKAGSANRGATPLRPIQKTLSPEGEGQGEGENKYFKFSEPLK